MFFVYREINSNHESSLPISWRRSSLVGHSPYGSFKQLPTELIYYLLQFLPRNISFFINSIEVLITIKLITVFHSDKYWETRSNIQGHAKHSYSMDWQFAAAQSAYGQDLAESINFLP